jgi:formylglycine-generating enzyme required for sulfatase activity
MPIPENFVRIEGGTFTMGSPSSEVDRNYWEGPQHQVTVSGFYMGKYEVTQAEYETVMGTNPSYFKGSNLPVENVSWYDAIAYCNRKSVSDGLTPAYTVNGENVTWNRNAQGGTPGYRLPTEAEWEYACRAGTATPFSTGNIITTEQANYDGSDPYNGNARGAYRERTTASGSFAANQWGLYDMHGNVWEWCWDWYGDYSGEAQNNPTGAVSGANRVSRGGSWDFNARYLRSAYRDKVPSGVQNYSLGFRLARS